MRKEVSEECSPADVGADLQVLAGTERLTMLLRRCCVSTRSFSPSSLRFTLLQRTTATVSGCGSRSECVGCAALVHMGVHPSRLCTQMAGILIDIHSADGKYIKQARVSGLVWGHWRWPAVAGGAVAVVKKHTEGASRQ